MSIIGKTLITMNDVKFDPSTSRQFISKFLSLTGEDDMVIHRSTASPGRAHRPPGQ